MTQPSTTPTARPITAPVAKPELGVEACGV